jgi:flagellar assembly protein FliH
LSERVIHERGKVRVRGDAPVGHFNLLEVEEAARGMIQQARAKVEEVTCKLGQLEEQYRRRREELSEEIRIKRQVCDEEIAALRARTEKELEALGTEVRERTHEEAKDAGFQDGFLRGRADGLTQGRDEGRLAAHEEMSQKFGKDFAAALAALESLVKDIDARREAFLRDAERDVVHLAIAIAEKVVKREIRECPDVVVNNVKKALEIIAQRSGARIEVNPDDAALLAEHASRALDIFRESPSLSIVPNAHVARGGCLVTSGGGGADLRIETQLELVEQALLGEKDGAVRTGTRALERA